MTEENGNKKVKKSIWKRWWFWAIVIFVVLIIASGGDNGDSPSSVTLQDRPATREESAPVSKPAPTPKKDDLSLESFEWDTGEFGIRYVVGVIKNNSNKKYSYVQVEINLYDESGAQVGSTLDNLNNLEPGGTWKFKAIVIEDEATEAKVAGITKF